MSLFPCESSAHWLFLHSVFFKVLQDFFYLLFKGLCQQVPDLLGTWPHCEFTGTLNLDYPTLFFKIPELYPKLIFEHFSCWYHKYVYWKLLINKGITCALTCQPSVKCVVREGQSTLKWCSESGLYPTHDSAFVEMRWRQHCSHIFLLILWTSKRLESNITSALSRKKINYQSTFFFLSLDH